MTGDVQIASATALDADTCRRLMLRSEPCGSRCNTVSATCRASWRSVATSNLLVANAAEGVIGFTLSAPGVLLGEYLKILVVNRTFQSQGVGRRLMEELERRAFQRWPNVYLCVSDFNTGARQFYRRLGYEEVGLLRDLLLPGKGEVLMRKSVAAWRRFGAPRDGYPPLCG